MVYKYLLLCVNTHTHSSQLGGEMQAVEAVVQTLSSQPSLTPDTVSTQLTSLFGQREEMQHLKPHLFTLLKLHGCPWLDPGRINLEASIFEIVCFSC